MNNKSRVVSQTELEVRLAQANEKIEDLLRQNASLRSAAAHGSRTEIGFDALVRSGVLGVMVVTRDGMVLEANEAFLRMVGYSREELIGQRRRLLELTAPDSQGPTLEAVEQTYMRGEYGPWEKEYLRKDGVRVRALLVNVQIADRAALVFVIDLSEKIRADEALRRTEEQLRQAQKMESIGRLAGGVAHDFNNMLSVILSYGELLHETAEAGSSLRADLEEITAAARRAAALTRQLLLFSRQQVVEPQIVDLNETVGGVEKMLRRTLGEDIELRSVSGDGLGRIMADPNEIEQVLLNLVVNARDAMPTGGALTIEASNVGPDEPRDLCAQIPSGALVRLTVKDTGTGMDEETKSHLFEPFFTTKERGKGTGLGLSTAFGIVQRAGGAIVVDSEPGKGTTFSIYFPRVEASAHVSRAPGAHTTVRGNETILLVEDEDQVRAIAGAILRKHGYRVIEARDPLEALTLYEERSQEIDLLLTDVVMPHMSGAELAKRIAAANPRTRILCMSGYTDDTIVRHGILDGDIAFLQKPLTPETLSRKVREVLEGRPAA